MSSPFSTGGVSGSGYHYASFTCHFQEGAAQRGISLTFQYQTNTNICTVSHLLQFKIFLMEIISQYYVQSQNELCKTTMINLKSKMKTWASLGFSVPNPSTCSSCSKKIFLQRPMHFYIGNYYHKDFIGPDFWQDGTDYLSPGAIFGFKYLYNFIFPFAFFWILCMPSKNCLELWANSLFDLMKMKVSALFSWVNKIRLLNNNARIHLNTYCTYIYKQTHNMKT